MKESKALKEWRASEQYRQAADQSYLLSGDIMYTRIWGHTREQIHELMPYLAGAVAVEKDAFLTQDQLVALELGKRLARVEAPRFSRQDVLVEEYLARYFRASALRPYGHGLLARDGWEDDSVSKIEKRAWMLQSYLRQCDGAHQPHLVARLSDERLFDAILWGVLVPSEPVGPGEEPEWILPSNWAVAMSEKNAREYGRAHGLQDLVAEEVQ